MRDDWLRFRVRRSTVIIFWLLIVAIFLGIYFFAPSLFNQMRQVSYQNTPYVDTPLRP
jgi:uncharacterized membrane protein affecting hemolysin expression